MATRGRVGLLMEDGKVMSIYNHWDSYPSNLGEILLKNYKDVEKIKKLIALGDCSSIREEVDVPEGKTHIFSKPLPNVTVSYRYDRGEEGCEARVDKNEEAYWKSDIEAFGYLFKDGKWYVKCSYAETEKVWELTNEIVNEEVDIES